MTPAVCGAFKHAKTLGEYVRDYINRSKAMGMSPVEAAYHANSPVEELDTINNWGDAEAVVYMTLHRQMHLGEPHDA